MKHFLLFVFPLLLAAQSTTRIDYGTQVKNGPGVTPYSPAGAVGDGVTDDTVALQKWILSLTPGFTGTVGTAGTFLISHTLWEPSNTHIDWSYSTLKRANGMVSDALAAGTYDGSTGVHGCNSGAVYLGGPGCFYDHGYPGSLSAPTANVSNEHLIVNGNNANTGCVANCIYNGYGISFQFVNGCTGRDITVYATPNDGIFTEWTANCTWDNIHVLNQHLYNMYFPANSSTNGMTLGGGGNYFTTSLGPADNLVVTNSSFENTDAIGLTLQVQTNGITNALPGGTMSLSNITTAHNGCYGVATEFTYGSTYNARMSGVTWLGMHSYSDGDSHYLPLSSCNHAAYYVTGVDGFVLDGFDINSAQTNGIDLFDDTKPVVSNGRIDGFNSISQGSMAVAAAIDGCCQGSAAYTDDVDTFSNITITGDGGANASDCLTTNIPVVVVQSVRTVGPCGTYVSGVGGGEAFNFYEATQVLMSGSYASGAADSGIVLISPPGGSTTVSITGSQSFNNGQNAGAPVRSGLSISGDIIGEVSLGTYDSQMTHTQQLGMFTTAGPLATMNLWGGGNVNGLGSIAKTTTTQGQTLLTNALVVDPSVLLPNLVTNPTFATSTGWTTSGPVTFGSSGVTFTNASTSAYVVGSSGPLVSGNVYSATFTLTSACSAGNLEFFIGGTSNLNLATASAAGTYGPYLFIDPPGGSGGYGFYPPQTTTTCTVTSLYIYPVGAGTVQGTVLTSTLSMGITAGTTVTSLPTCGAGYLGQIRRVSDSVSATPGASPVGSGTYTINVQCIYNSSGTTYAWIVD